MKRKIIEIDEEKCNGCGLCIPNCQEGALKVIDGKARLISDLFCDGLGACIGHCPEGAIEIIEREAEPYNETKVMETISVKGRNTILAHLDHLRSHQEHELLKEAIDYLKENKIDIGTEKFEKPEAVFSGCPGSMARDFRSEAETQQKTPAADTPSELRQWPIQLHLLNPQATYLKNADLVLAADCTAFALGSFHSRYLKGKSLAIACPKLDSNMDSYVQKLTTMITTTKINSLQVIMMEVPCCGGLLQMAKMAREAAGINIPIKKSYLSIQGEVLEEEWS
ncbi:MAG: 4Fe-4S binding protein [bacterium]